MQFIDNSAVIGLTRNSEKEPSNYEHSKNLDFIRSFAVLLVVTRHLSEYLGYRNLGPIPMQFVGIFGVLLFFVLTAHVLMFSMERIEREENTGVAAIKSFLIRRAFRIYPLSISVVLCVYCAAEIFNPNISLNLTNSELIANILLIQNLTHARDIIGPLWSLPIEVQMYAILPAAYFLIKNQPWTRASSIYIVFVILGLISIKTKSVDVLRYAPWFISGVIAYWLAKNNPQKILPFYTSPLLLGISLLAYGKLGQYSQTAGAYPICLILGVAIPFIKEPTTGVVTRVSELISKYSYGIYLTHAPVLSLCFATNLPVTYKLIAFILATAGISIVVYRYIEHPMILLGKKLTRGSQKDSLVPKKS